MKIEILGAESLGVRGLSCWVKTVDRRVLIDPGVALGYRRAGLLPHPAQVAVGEEVRQAIVNRLTSATDVVFSHFHGDHMPLKDANPFQLSLHSVTELLRKPQLWIKRENGETPRIAKRRKTLLATLERSVSPCDGQVHGSLAFSDPMPHGFVHSRAGTIMMTRIQEGSEIFVHASDIQFLADEPIEQILKWSPTTLLASGPAVYRNLPTDALARARERILVLARNIGVCIIDHHLLRCREGILWLDSLRSETRGRVMCAADFMKKKRWLLEAERTGLYERFPVPNEWHELYADGKVTTRTFRDEKCNAYLDGALETGVNIYDY